MVHNSHGSKPGIYALSHELSDLYLPMKQNEKLIMQCLRLGIR